MQTRRANIPKPWMLRLEQERHEMTVKFEDIKKGQIFYEGAYGFNLEMVALEDAKIIKEFGQDEGVLSGKKQFGFAAKNTQTGDLQDYVLTEGLAHYGPSLYRYPPYIKSEKDEKNEIFLTFPLMGGGVLDLDCEIQKNMRAEDVVAGWIASGSEIALEQWFLENRAEKAPEATPDL
jgi:hypothetical protein